MAGINGQEALDILQIESEPDIFALFRETSRQRIGHFGRVISCCSIINARCGSCPEDCAFCAQSAHAHAEVERYPLLSREKILASAREMEGNAAWFSIVTSGRAVRSGPELDQVCETVSAIGSEHRLHPCASLGVLCRSELEQLKDAGLRCYHHNLEASESFFPSICSTRTYQDQINAIVAAKEAGLKVCSGGIFGLGETREQRIELLETVRNLNVDSVPINFLVPVPGTRLEHNRELNPLDCLKIIAAARLMMPEKEVRICGGREYNLRDLHSWIFAAGANGIMIGNYLTTSGRDVAKDMQLLDDLGLEPEQWVSLGQNEL